MGMDLYSERAAFVSMSILAKLIEPRGLQKLWPKIQIQFAHHLRHTAS